MRKEKKMSGYSPFGAIYRALLILSPSLKNIKKKLTTTKKYSFETIEN